MAQILNYVDGEAAFFIFAIRCLSDFRFKLAIASETINPLVWSCCHIYHTIGLACVDNGYIDVIQKKTWQSN